MRPRKPAAIVSRFLLQQYGIGWKDISSKMRATLLHEVEHVPCNLCGRDDAQPVAGRDKYGLALVTVLCKGCGLLYLDPRPTADSYRRFYEQGGQQNSMYHPTFDFSSVEEPLKFYFGADFAMDEQARAAMAKFMADRAIGPDCRPIAGKVPQAAGDGEAADDAELYNDEEDAENGEKPQLDLDSAGVDYYGRHLYDELKDLVPVGGKVFEPGASWGKTLHPWKALHHCQATGVEPKRESVRRAKEVFGIDLLQGFADDPRIPENTYDLVFNTRTINHMLDPLGDLRNAWRWLKPGGVLFVDIADAIKEARFESFERSVVEIDHPYMFSTNTLTAMIQKAGFAIVKKEIIDLQRLRDWDDRAAQPKQIHITARKSVEPVAVDWPDPMGEVSELLQAQLEFDRAQVRLGASRRESHHRLKASHNELKESYRTLRADYQNLRTQHRKLETEITAMRDISNLSPHLVFDLAIEPSIVSIEGRRLIGSGAIIE